MFAHGPGSDRLSSILNFNVSATNMSLLTLEEALASQKDLGNLCADRPLDTNEIFQPNAFYGNDSVLKRYAGLPQEYPLKVIIPHGIVFADDFVWKEEARSFLPAVWCYSSHRESAYINATRKVVIRSASPFLYAVEMLKGQPQPERRGTIFFPAHSTHYVTSQMDFEALAEELTHLGEEHQPVTVCIYWRDFNLGHHLPFQEHGFPIVSAGHIYDRAFLFRLYHLCSMHRYAASNELGSQLFYSIKSGCSYFHLDKFRSTPIAEDRLLERDTSRTAPGREADLKSLFSTPQPSTTAEQMRAVDYYLGTGYLESPQGLRSQLLHAERLDKFGFVVHNRGERARFVVPSYYWRTVMNLAINLKLAGVMRKVRRLWGTTGEGNKIC